MSDGKGKAPLSEWVGRYGGVAVARSLLLSCDTPQKEPKSALLNAQSMLGQGSTFQNSGPRGQIVALATSTGQSM